MNNSNEFYQEIGNRIREARNNQGLSQDSLASCLNLTRNSIINLEKGRHKPSVYQIYELSGILNVDFFSLIPIQTSQNIETHTQIVNRDYIFDRILSKENENLILNLVSNL